MNIKEIINNPKIWQFITTILTAILGYFGYVEVSKQTSSPDVDVEVIVPKHKENIPHKHKDWLPDIKDEIEKSRNSHNDNFH